MRSLVLAAALFAAPAFADLPVPLNYTGAVCFTDHVQITVGGSSFVQCHTQLEAVIGSHSSGTVSVAEVRFCAANGSGPLMPACANYEDFSQPGTGGDGVVTIGEILGISGFDLSLLNRHNGGTGTGTATGTNIVTIGEILGAHQNLRQRYRIDEYESELHRVLTGQRKP